jgi:hypothetical protein
LLSTIKIRTGSHPNQPTCGKIYETSDIPLATANLDPPRELYYRVQGLMADRPCGMMAEIAAAA